LPDCREGSTGFPEGEGCIRSITAPRTGRRGTEGWRAFLLASQAQLADRFASSRGREVRNNKKIVLRLRSSSARRRQSKQTYKKKKPNWSDAGEPCAHRQQEAFRGEKSCSSVCSQHWLSSR
jgi:hypothetical protein